MGYFISFVGGALLTLVVVTVGGVGQVDCTEVRDIWAAYRHEVRVNPERVDEMLAYAEDNRQCFSSWEFTGGSADELPPLPGEE
jgi:hypothetical protein